MKHQYNIIIAESVEIEPELTFAELCEVYHVAPTFIQELIDYGILELDKFPDLSYRFQSDQIKKIHRVTRLQKELEINMAGTAVVLDLLEELDELKNRLAIYERYLNSH